MHPSHHHQLQHYGISHNASTNSAHSSPLKRAPLPAVSPLASPMESRRLFVPSAPAQPSVSSSTDHSMLNAIQLGYTLAGPAQPAKLLVDPHTGQQYFVPTTPQPMSYFAAPAPLFYPNQFYSTPANATAQPHSGFMVGNQPSISPWSTQTLNSAHSSHQRKPAQSPSSAISSASMFASTVDGAHPRQSQNFSAYHVEMPLSSVGSRSVCEEVDFGQCQQQSSFQRQDQTRQSTESRGSVRSAGECHPQDTQINQRDQVANDRFSPPHSPSDHFHSALPRKFQLQPDHLSTGGSSTESTSGFASGRDRFRTEEASEGRSPPQSPFMRKNNNLSHVEDEDGKPFRSDIAKIPPSKSLPQRMKAIRMDIDLNRPISPPDREQHVSVQASVLRTAPPTAFTIPFNDISPYMDDISTLSNPSFESVGGAHEISLQEAARQAPTGRRLMATRRSVPPRPVPTKAERSIDSGSEAGDPKRWLFRKMMLSRDQRANETEERDGNENGSDDDNVDDMVSETGTYVVESKRMSKSRPTTSTVSPRDGRSGNSLPPSTCSPSSSNSSSSRTPSPNPMDGEVAAGTKRSLMNDLRRLREQKKNFTGPSTKAFPAKELVSQHIPSGHIRHVVSSSNSANRVENTPFRPKPIGSAASRCRSEPRSDGGRFSMRGTQPKMADALGKNAAQQQSPEMTAWLRRKEYDPRKAAAAATDKNQKDTQQQGQQHDSFMACRSFSTSANAKSPFARWRQSRKAQLEMDDQRGNRSHDDLSRLGESMDDESLPCMTGDLCSSSLQRTVDELTQKCFKSIELLKLCNHSGLSSSVEQLLEKVVERSSGTVEVQFGTTVSSESNAHNENISDRLERLSSAFDAIQKYLEETSMNSSRASFAALTELNLTATDEGKIKK